MWNYKPHVEPASINEPEQEPEQRQEQNEDQERRPDTPTDTTEEIAQEDEVPAPPETEESEPAAELREAAAPAPAFAQEQSAADSSIPMLWRAQQIFNEVDGMRIEIHNRILDLEQQLHETEQCVNESDDVDELTALLTRKTAIELLLNRTIRQEKEQEQVCGAAARRIENVQHEIAKARWELSAAQTHLEQEQARLSEAQQVIAELEHSIVEAQRNVETARRHLIVLAGSDVQPSSTTAAEEEEPGQEQAQEAGQAQEPADE